MSSRETACEHKPVKSVFVVDDNHGYRSVAAAVIEATTGFQMVGEAADPDEALSAVIALEPPPDLVLMDVNLGNQSGVELTASILAHRPEVQVLLVSVLAADELPPGAAGCGAVGYVPKAKLGPTSLVEALAGTYDWGR